MDLHLEKKVIIVTGGAGGIGEAVCALLAAEGAIPCILDLKKGNFFSVQVELSDPGNCRRAVETVLNKFDRIDGLVNNAGLNDGIGLDTGDDHTFMQSVRRNAGHYYQVAKMSLPALKRSRGAIVNIVSKVAVTGQGHTSGYAAANGLRLQFTKEWAQELSPSGIRVNGVVVAECWTPGYEQWIAGLPDGQERLKKIAARIPLGHRLTLPKEIAETVVFLLSPRSKGVNGELVFVDGGYVHLDRGLD
jgi:L-fucose dehydrogenase